MRDDASDGALSERGRMPKANQQGRGARQKPRGGRPAQGVDDSPAQAQRERLQRALARELNKGMGANPDWIEALQRAIDATGAAPRASKANAAPASEPSGCRRGLIALLWFGSDDPPLYSRSVPARSC